MRDYALLAKAFRHCEAKKPCGDCPMYGECPDIECRKNAADAIEELLAKVPHWISADDDLPKPESMVLVATKYGGVYYGFINHSGKFYTANNTLYDSWCWEPDVTHWMPLPTSPGGAE